LAMGVGAPLAAGASLTVTTATTLVLHVRRDETDIMRLVGAPEYVIRLPLLMQGALQGLIGDIVAVGALVAAYRVLAPHLEPLAALTLALPSVTFLPPVALAGLVLGGTTLGGFGGLLARRRGHA